MGNAKRYDLDRSKKTNMWLKFDYILMSAVVGLAVIGLVMLPSAMIGYANSFSRVLMQIICFAIGIAIAILLSCIDYIVFKHMAIFFYIANLFMMLLVYTPLGVSMYGAERWINLGIMTYQPSELLKLATIIMVAVCLEDMKLDKGRTLYNILRIGFFFVVPMGLVILQKDLGTTLVFVFFFVAMLFIAGLKLRYFLIAGAVGTAVIPFIWKFLMDDVRRNRIISFLDPESDPQGMGFQALKAKYSIGSGQLFGKGLGNGPMNNAGAGAVPVKEADFIFSVIGEELGFIGCVAVVILFFVLLLKAIEISRRSSDYFGEYVSIGIFAVFAFHFWENIGMNIQIMPITGIPLPFLSAGGSALLTNFFSIGVLLSISARRKHEGYFVEEH